VLIGVPGAGKTTLARALAEAAVRRAVECVHLELDGLLLAAAARGGGGSGGGTGEFSPEAWRVRVCVDVFFAFD
jgi:adenylate kinase family enzyme